MGADKNKNISMYGVIGHKIKVAMVDARLTQSDLAERVGLSPLTVSRHINGRSPMTVEQLTRYSAALGVRFSIEPPADAPAVGLEPTTYRFQPAADQGSAA